MKRVYNQQTGTAFGVGSDAVGHYFERHNGVKEYMLTIAITHNDVTTAVAGSHATTSHATGKGKIFISTDDTGLKWKALTQTA